MAIDTLGAIPAVSFRIKNARSLVMDLWMVNRTIGLTTCCRYKWLHISFQTSNRQRMTSDELNSWDEFCLWRWCDFGQSICATRCQGWRQVVRIATARSIGTSTFGKEPAKLLSSIRSCFRIALNMCRFEKCSFSERWLLSRDLAFRHSFV